MRSTRFAWKVFGAVLATAVACAVVADQVFVRSARGYAQRELERELRGRALAFAALVANATGGAAPGTAPVPLPREDLVRYTLIAEDGAVLGDSHEDPRLMEDHTDRAELAAPGTVVRRTSQTLARTMRYCAAPVRAPDGTVALYARVAVFESDLEARAAELRRRWRTALGAGLALALALAALFARALTRPIAEMVEALEAPRGRLRLPVRRADELGQLARSINRMGDVLEERLALLRRDQLEKDAILAGMTEGVVAVDEVQHVVLMNAAAREMLGAARADPVGRPLWEVTRVPEVVQTVAASIDEARHVAAEARIVDGDRSRVFVLGAAPLVRAGGEHHGCVLVLHEVSELRRLEAVRRDFVANVSHELKTPLTAMRGYLETVLDDPDMPADTRTDFLQKAEKSTSRLAAIVSDLLSLARVQSETGPDRRPLDLAALARECVSEERANAERRMIDLALEPAESRLLVSADERMLTTAVRNLLDNAIKYSPEESRVRVVLGADDGYAWLDVVDRGPGIPAAHQQRVFERFYRVDKDRSRAVGGTGLGLSIVKNVMVAHDGDVSVESRPGHGSRFRIRLPLLGRGGDPE